MKRPETRARRIQRFIRMLEKHEKLHPQFTFCYRPPAALVAASVRRPSPGDVLNRGRIIMTVSALSTPNRAAIQLGFWSAFAIAALFIIFTLCFVAIALTPPLFTWTNLADYVAFATSHNQLFQNVARLTMLLFGPLYVMLLSSIHGQVPEEARLWTRIALCFGTVFAALTGINYFVQLSAVRLSLLKGEFQGLDQVVQANPISAISAINMLGWTLFLGLSSIFVAQAFSGSRLERGIRAAFLFNGVCCLLGGIGYVFDIVALVFVTINLGMGGAVLVAAILLCVLYKRIERGQVR